MKLSTLKLLFYIPFVNIFAISFFWIRMYLQEGISLRFFFRCALKILAAVAGLALADMILHHFWEFPWLTLVTGLCVCYLWSWFALQDLAQYYGKPEK